MTRPNVASAVSDAGRVSVSRVSHPTLAASVAVSSTTHSKTPPVTPQLYPEMLSPAVTRALVQQVYDRAVSEDDPYRSLQLHSSSSSSPFPRKK